MPGESVKVMVRVRPMNSNEKQNNCRACLTVDEKANLIVLQKDDQSKEFTFDNVFTSNSLQQYIYETSAFQLVESVAEGYNGTIFAYGQTGCGKTFTMMGVPTDENLRGIIPRSFSHIVNLIETSKEKKFLVRCSYIEIYNEEIHDLLSVDAKARRELKESVDKGIFVKDLTMCIVKSVDEMERNMNQGNKNRAVAETQMNKDSSRSHSIFTLYIESSQVHLNEEVITAGKLNLVDLAGSERQSKTQATGDRLKVVSFFVQIIQEGSKINLSLSALGNVISALVDGKSQHIPYRDSKLTRLLQDSLGGNTKTIMIAAISPADYNYEESLSTLRYASRAKFIKNQPKINEDPKDALLKEYAEEIKRLKQMISIQQDGGQKQEIVPQQQSTQQLSQSDLQKLQQEKQQISEEYQKQLRQQEETVERERAERAKLEQMIKELEQKTIQGGTKQETDQQKKYKQMQSRLKSQQKEQERLKYEKEQKENELNFMEKNYQSLQDEVDGLRNVLAKLRQKYKQALNDIDDINRESEMQREDLLETIRTQEKELKLYQGIIKILVSVDELETIKSASEWNEDLKEFIIPPFYLKEKKLKFPKYQQLIKILEAIDLIDKEKEQRQLTFKKDWKQSSIGEEEWKKKTGNMNNGIVGGQMELNSALKELMDVPKNMKNQVQVDKKNQKVMLEPLAQMDHMQERLERQNNSTSLPPPHLDGNTYYKRQKSRNQKGEIVKLDQILKPIQTEQNPPRKPPKGKLDRVEQ